MPKDKRLYMTFPIDIHRHPKMLRLSAEAKWAFVEMNGEARLAKNDGRFSAEDAEYLWSRDVLDQLLRSHPSRPLVVRDGSDYLIREYEKHQQTAAEVEELSAKRSAAGRQGAAATNAKRSASAAASAGESAASAAAVAEQEVGLARQAAAQSQSQSQSEPDLDTQLLPPSSLDPAARDFSREEIEGFRKALSGFGGDGLDELGLLTLVELLVEASPRPVSNYVGYVVRCTQRSPLKVRGLVEVAARDAASVPSLAEIAADLDRAVAS